MGEWVTKSPVVLCYVSDSGMVDSAFVVGTSASGGLVSIMITLVVVAAWWERGAWCRSFGTLFPSLSINAPYRFPPLYVAVSLMDGSTTSSGGAWGSSSR